MLPDQCHNATFVVALGGIISAASRSIPQEKLKMSYESMTYVGTTTLSKVPHSHREDLKSHVKSHLKSLDYGTVHGAVIFNSIGFTSTGCLSFDHIEHHVVLKFLGETPLSSYIPLKNVALMWHFLENLPLRHSHIMLLISLKKSFSSTIGDT